jgi:predicted phosphoribosyltransferase
MGSRTFSDRAEAGRLLGERLVTVLAARSGATPVVLGLPRGGVVVAAQVAAVLGVPVDVFVARKIGHPRQPEYGLGALAEDGDPVFDEDALAATGLTASDLARVVAVERHELIRRVEAYRRGRTRPALEGRTVVLVDDGIATGVTARAALRALRRQRPADLVLAVPVAAPQSLRDLAAEADDVIALLTPAAFGSVGRCYAEFPQVSDDEVIRLLAGSADYSP